MTTAKPNRPFPETVLTKLSELGLGTEDIELAIYAKLPENLKWFDYKKLLDAHNRADAVWHEQILQLLSKAAVNKREYMLTLEVLGKQLDIKTVLKHTNLTRNMLDKYRSCFIQGKDGVDMKSELDVFASARYDVFKDEGLLNDLIFACINKVSVDDLDVLYADCPPVCKAEDEILKYWRAFMLGNIPAKGKYSKRSIQEKGEAEDGNLKDVRNKLFSHLSELNMQAPGMLLERYKTLRKIVYTYYEIQWHYLGYYD